MALSDWKYPDEGDTLSPTTDAPTNYQRLMQIKICQTSGDNGKEPWSALSGLPLLAEDKSFLHGAIGMMQLPNALTYQLLATYRAKWEQAASRHRYPNGADNAGRKAANLWILNGAEGFIGWSAADKPP